MVRNCWVGFPGPNSRRSSPGQWCVATAFTNRHGIYKFLEAAKALTVHKAVGCHLIASYFVRLSKLPLGFIHLFINLGFYLCWKSFKVNKGFVQNWGFSCSPWMILCWIKLDFFSQPKRWDRDESQHDFPPPITLQSELLSEKQKSAD